MEEVIAKEFVSFTYNSDIFTFKQIMEFVPNFTSVTELTDSFFPLNANKPLRVNW